MPLGASFGRRRTARRGGSSTCIGRQRQSSRGATTSERPCDRGQPRRPARPHSRRAVALSGGAEAELRCRYLRTIKGLLGKLKSLDEAKRVLERQERAKEEKIVVQYRQRVSLLQARARSPGPSREKRAVERRKRRMGGENAFCARRSAPAARDAVCLRLLLRLEIQRSAGDSGGHKSLFDTCRMGLMGCGICGAGHRGGGVHAAGQAIV